MKTILCLIAVLLSGCSEQYLSAADAGLSYNLRSYGTFYAPQPAQAVQPTIRCTTMHFSWGDQTNCR